MKKMCLTFGNTKFDFVSYFYFSNFLSKVTIKKDISEFLVVILAHINREQIVFEMKILLIHSLLYGGINLQLKFIILRIGKVIGNFL